MNKPPRVHVQSADKKITYGAFQANNCSEFTNWDQLSPEETIELKQYMNNLNAIEHFFSTKALSEQKDFRIKLPGSLIQAITEISIMCIEEGSNLDIYGAIISASIQQLKVKASGLSNNKKQLAFSILDQLGLSENNKPDLLLKIQAVFSELLSVYNKSEKLHQKALTLFGKDKSLAPKTIEEIAKGGLSSPRWQVACALEILLEEKPDIIQKLLSNEDILFLWAIPLLKNQTPIKDLIVKIDKLQNSEKLKNKLISMNHG